MRDDTLTLYTTVDPPIAPADGEVTLYPQNDGDGVARLMAVTPDGVRHPLTPEQVPASTLPPVALTTAASHGPTSYVGLVVDAPTSTYVGVAHRAIAAQGAPLPASGPRSNG